MLTKRERLHLGYLRANAPAWGGHLRRGEPITDPDMQRWVDAGLIEPRGTDGYVLTEAGERALAA